MRRHLLARGEEVLQELLPGPGHAVVEVVLVVVMVVGVVVVVVQRVRMVGADHTTSIGVNWKQREYELDIGQVIDHMADESKKGFEKGGSKITININIITSYGENLH